MGAVKNEGNDVPFTTVGKAIANFNNVKKSVAKRKKKTYFHATPLGNLESILAKGIEPRNVERVVYLCESAFDCLKFAKIHGVTDALVCEVRLYEDEVVETFDHNYEFFKCRCFGVSRTVKLSEIKQYWRYKDF